MYFSPRISAITALVASTSLASSFLVGNVRSEETATVPPTLVQAVTYSTTDDVSLYVEGKVVDTQRHLVDPWIRPPRGVVTQQAHGLPGDFDGYPRITASPFDQIQFNMRPIAREGDNTQRHGVYVLTDKSIVQDYLDGTTEHPCGPLMYTDEKPCQVVEYEGLNATDCEYRETLFPLLEIKGDAGMIEYTVSNLGELAAKYGVATASGSSVLAFDCPWIQGRDLEGSGRTSHCIGGMYAVVEVLSEASVLEAAAAPACEQHDDHDSHDDHDHSDCHCDADGSGGFVVHCSDEDAEADCHCESDGHAHCDGDHDHDDETLVTEALSSGASGLGFLGSVAAGAFVAAAL